MELILQGSDLRPRMGEGALPEVWFTSGREKGAFQGGQNEPRSNLSHRVNFTHTLRSVVWKILQAEAGLARGREIAAKRTKNDDGDKPVDGELCALLAGGRSACISNQSP